MFDWLHGAFAALARHVAGLWALGKHCLELLMAKKSLMYRIREENSLITSWLEGNHDDGLQSLQYNTLRIQLSRPYTLYHWPAQQGAYA